MALKNLKYHKKFYFNPNAKNKKIADEITALATKILECKKQGKDTSELESKINDLVYALYELTQDEIQIVEST